MRLYRASDLPPGGTWECWAADVDDARAYHDNPGMGGPDLYAVDVEPQRVCRLRSLTDISTLAQALADVLPDAFERLEAHLERGVYSLYQVWEEEDWDLRQYMTAALDWVVYEDDYPTGCETWLYVGRDPLAGVEWVERAPQCPCGQYVGSTRCTVCGGPACRDCQRECDRCYEAAEAATA